MRPKPGQACFVAGTQVAVGTDAAGNPLTRNIEDLRRNDVVLSRDQYDAADDATPHVVTNTFVRTVFHERVLTIRDAGGNVETLRTTDEHPFHVTGVGWTRAGGLAVGQVLSEADGTNDAAVIGTERVERPEGLAVYNLEVEGDHTYFVEDGRGGKTAVWVHNTCSGLHHMVPKSLGINTPYGNDSLTLFSEFRHTKIHKRLAIFLQGAAFRKTLPDGRVIDMCARKGNSGKLISQYFSAQEREAALDSFYKSYNGGEYYQAFKEELAIAKAAGWW